MLGVSLFLSLSLFTLSFVIFLSLFFLIPLFPLLLSLLPRACHLRRRDRNRPKAESQANNTLSRTLSLFTTIKHVTPTEGWTTSYIIVVHHYQTRHSNGRLHSVLHIVVHQKQAITISLTRWQDGSEVMLAVSTPTNNYVSYFILFCVFFFFLHE